MTGIVLIDKTSRPEICQALPIMASLMAVQCGGEFRQSWGIGDVTFRADGDVKASSLRASIGRLFGARDQASAPPEWPCYFVPTLDDPNALAYHDDESGYPGLYVGVDAVLSNGGNILTGPGSLLSALSHEVLEALVDPFCDWYSFFGPNKMVSLEVCDPVEDGCYDVSDGTNTGSVSNFVLPEWFRPGTSKSGKYDWMGVLKVPTQISKGGYLTFSDGTSTFGEGMKAWKRELKAKHSRRLRKLRARS